MSVVRIGDFLVAKKVLTQAEVEQILDYGKRKSLRFGDAGLELGLLTEETMIRVFGKNYRIDFFHLDPVHFPRKTMQVLTLETILKYGVLPLGFKAETGFFKRGKTLNLGMIDPGRKDAIELAEKEAGPEFTRSKRFLVLADQFISVLYSVYELSPAQLMKIPSEALDRTLSLFLEEKH